MTQLDKTEAAIAEAEAAREDGGSRIALDLMEDHARALARKLDEIRLYAWQQNSEDVQEHINAILGGDQ